MRPEKPVSRAFGIPTSEFHQRYPHKGLITKLEVRVLAIASMGLREDSIVWDIGAGSGAISIEAARLASRGQVFAVEKNETDAENIRKNVEKFGAGNVRIVVASAPDGLGPIPDPDSVFIGGSGGRLEAILKAACARLRPGGRLVMNAASVESLSRGLTYLRKLGWHSQITLAAIARSRVTADLTRFEALNPVFIVCAQRKGEEHPANNASTKGDTGVE